MAARKSKIAAKMTIKSENGVLVSEKKNFIMLKMTFLDYLQINKYLNESILPAWDFRRGPQWGKVRKFVEKAVLQQKLFSDLNETKLK